MEKTPLSLSDDLDPNMPIAPNVTENGVFHESRRGAALAARLVENGTPQDLALAERVLEIVLNAQERRPNDPHTGNFFWMIEDDVVFDLNAVEFNLEHLIPMLIEHGDRLPKATRQRVEEAVRAGLAEIARLDVLPVYSNITLLDILNTCLGGELLGDAEITRRGCQKLIAWMDLTAHNGTAYEYNSPTYGAVVIRALGILARLVQDADTRIRARAALARLGLSAALHIHTTTGRWAGPHSRSYHPTIQCETPPEIDMLREWQQDGTLPGWMNTLLDDRPTAFEVTETAFAARDLALTTYQSPEFALGVSACEFGGQSNVLMAHYARPGADKPGVFYTRYLLNDHWLGDFYHATDRTRSRNLVEEGRFLGVQQGPSAIGLYTVPNNVGVISSAKAALIWQGRAQVDEIWIRDRKVESLPVQVQPGEVLVVGSGAAWMAVRPLQGDNLGREAPMQLIEKDGDLVFELYTYRGEPKSFWDLGWPGAFYHGKPRCGFYFEMAARDEYSSGADFAAAVAAGQLDEETQAPFTYAGEGQRRWAVSYQRGQRSLGIAVDLMAWKLLTRQQDGREMGWPMLESNLARENRDGSVRVGEAELTFSSGAGWLYACPQRRLWVAGLTTLQPAALTLQTPAGNVRVGAMGTGVLVFEDGQVTLDGVDVQAEPVVEKAA